MAARKIRTVATEVSNDPHSLRVEVLDVTDEEITRKVSHLIAEAMCRDSGWAYMFGKNNDKDLEWMIYRHLWLNAGCTFVYYVSDNLIGTCTIVKPGHKPPSTWDLLRLGFVKLPFFFGFAAYKRLVELQDFFEKSTFYGKVPTFGVHMLAVDKSHRGKGYGSAILKDCLENETDQTSLVVLATQTERNVAFYKRFGFEVTEKHTFRDGPEKSGFHSWDMRLRREVEK